MEWRNRHLRRLCHSRLAVGTLPFKVAVSVKIPEEKFSEGIGRIGVVFY